MRPVRTRLRILGSVRITHVFPDGTEKENHTGGVAGAIVPGLLASLVFSPQRGDRAAIATELWGVPDRVEDQARDLSKLSSAAHRVRDLLGRDLEVFPNNRTEPLRLDPAKRLFRGSAQARNVNPDPRLLIDWDHVLLLQADGRHLEALSLIEGEAFADAKTNMGDYELVAALIDEARDEVRRTAIVSLEALGREVPDPLVLGKHLKPHELRFPKEWISSQSWRSPTASAPEPSHGSLVSPRRGHRGGFSVGEFWEPPEEAERHRQRELSAGDRRGAETWWSRPGARWFGAYYAFWSRTVDTPCERIAFEFDRGRLDAERFGLPPELNSDNDKAVLVSATDLRSDPLHGDRGAPALRCATTTYGFALRWAKDNASAILGAECQPTVFGLSDRPAYPGIAGVHTLVQTSDGYLLFALREHNVAYHALTWSASFEESVSVHAREFTGDPNVGDQSVYATLAGGLFEEWGIEPEAVEATTLLAVGREYVRVTAERLDLSSSILTATRLSLGLTEVWDRLDDITGIPDRDEHRCWAGCRFASRDDVLRFVAASRGQSSGIDLLPQLTSGINAELRFYPGAKSVDVGHRGLMPTSAARLALGSEWMYRQGTMDEVS